MACCDNVIVTGQNEGKRAHRPEIELQGKVSFCNQLRAYPIGSPVCPDVIPIEQPPRE